MIRYDGGVPVRVAKLVGDPGRRSYLLPLRAVTIGRNDRCDVVIEDDSVSRRHARICERHGRYWLADLGSMNGTYLEGDPITDERELRQGARVRLGGVSLKFTTVDADEGGPPPVPAAGSGAPPATPATERAGSGDAGRRGDRARDLS
jgi:pSer/pThr/pTyr-binding forkhead associated (FHA) protein